MKKKTALFFLILFCICTFEAEAQTAAASTIEACQYSTEGTEFWFGFLKNRTTNTHYLQITVTSQTDATVTLTYGTSETVINTYSVPANGSTQISIDYSTLEPTASESAENKGIHLVSDNPVNVYAFNYDTRSSDVAVIYPVVSLGSEYYAICYTPHSDNSSTDDPRSEFLVVATETGTTVTITTSAATEGGHSANSAFSVLLQPGQVYQVRSVSGSTGDLTGSHVVADKPIAFFSGCSATSVPTTGGTVDHLYEQIPPLTTWGREFYAVPLYGRTQDTYRVLASEDNTVVTIGATGTTKTLSKGGYCEFTLSSSQAGKITATKKVLVAQYCRSQLVDNTSGIGDPLMIIISPVSQKISDVTFTAYASSLINYYYINLVVLTSETGLLTLDGSSISSSKFTAFSGTKYSYAQISVSSGSHRLISSSTSTDGGFLASVYGFGSSGSTESYGYGVGFSLNLQLDLSEGMDVDDSGALTICEGETIELDAGSYFDTYQWSVKYQGDSYFSNYGGAMSSTFTVSKAGEYCVEATSSALSCTESSCITIKTDKPEVEIIATATVACTESELTVSPTTYSSYVWQDGSTSQTYTVEKTGNYSVTVTDRFGCKSMAGTQVDILLPKVGFSVDYEVVTVLHPCIAFTNLTESTNVTYQWDFGDGSTSSEENPVHCYAITATGTTYTVTLTATSNLVSGCSDSYEMTIRMVPLSFNMPNAFRPSSGISINQTFQPVIVNLDEDKYRFRIFNRNGSVVFETTDYATGWDGTFSGNNAGVGVYVWIVEYTDVQGFSYTQKGTVMLLR